MVYYSIGIWDFTNKSTADRQDSLFDEKASTLMGSIFNSDFIEFVECLNSTNVEYLLVGGYATILHGYNRSTGDLDIWVNQTEENYDRLVGAYFKFNMPLFDMTRDRFLYDNSLDVFTFGRPPVSIDIITKLKGLTFKEAYEKAVSRQITSTISVRLIHVNDLIAAKKASNRPKDQDDIQHLI